MKTRHVLSEAAIVNYLYQTDLDEGMGDFLKKAVEKVKQISSSVKEFMLKKADAISAWADKNIWEPLKKHMESLVPGYSWGSGKSNVETLISSVIELLAKKNKIALESRLKSRHLNNSRVSRGVQRYLEAVEDAPMFESRYLVEAGAIGAVLSIIHWSHFSIDVLEAILKVAPSIPFLAGLITKLNNVKSFMEKNPKLSKALDWYEHGKIGSLNAKDVINSICIAIGIVEICMGGGIWIILSTAASAVWVVGEKIWHHYKKYDKEASAIKESFFRRGELYFSESVENSEEFDDPDDDEDYEEEDSEGMEDDDEFCDDEEDCDEIDDEEDFEDSTEDLEESEDFDYEEDDFDAENSIDVEDDYDLYDDLGDSIDVEDFDDMSIEDMTEFEDDEEDFEEACKPKKKKTRRFREEDDLDDDEDYEEEDSTEDFEDDEDEDFDSEEDLDVDQEEDFESESEIEDLEESDEDFDLDDDEDYEEEDSTEDFEDDEFCDDEDCEEDELELEECDY